MLDRATFYAAIRPKLFDGVMTRSQVEGIGAILDEWERRALTDLRWLAYMLATVFHETAKKMQPCREMGSEGYLRAKPYYPWVGEGLVQVTWETNARKFGAAKPGDCLSWPIALKALFDGMLKGMFTGKKLGDYFNATSDPIGARRIINGTDRASLIAGYYNTIFAALLTASAVGVTPVPKPMTVQVETSSTRPQPLPPYVPPVAGPHSRIAVVAKPSVWVGIAAGLKSFFFARKA